MTTWWLVAVTIISVWSWFTADQKCRMLLKHWEHMNGRIQALERKMR